MTAKRQRFRLRFVRWGTLLHAEVDLGPLAVPALDLLASAVLVTLAIMIGATQATTPVQHVALIVAALSVSLRRDAPLLAAVILCLGVTGMALGGPGEVDCAEILPALALLAFAVGADRRRDRAVGVGLFVLAVMSIEMVQDPVMGPSGIVLFAPFLFAVWLGGRATELFARRAGELERRSAELERQRAETSRLAVALERDRVDGELQATISEGLRVILATSAATRNEHEPLAEGLAVIEDRSRLLLDDMRGVLGILRSHTAGPVRAPLPSLRDIDRLLVDARARGIAVSLSREGTERPVADAPARSAFRIIERALEWTSEQEVNVGLRWRERELEVEITTAQGSGWPAVLAAAHERAAVCGGRVARTRQADGRAGLRAHLPLAGVRA